MSVHTCMHADITIHTYTQKLVHRYLYNNSIHPKNVDISSKREREEAERETITEKKM